MHSENLGINGGLHGGLDRLPLPQNHSIAGIRKTHIFALITIVGFGAMIIGTGGLV